MRTTADFNALVDEYLTQPALGPEGHQALMRYAMPRARVICEELAIVRDDDVDPYDNFAQLASDVRGDGMLRVGPTPEHPYWDTETMRMYRVWHDIDGHLAFQASFDRYGEFAVLRGHLHALMSARCRLSAWEAQEAAAALFNEVMYRVACGIVCNADDIPPHRPVEPGPVASDLIASLLAY